MGIWCALMQAGDLPIAAAQHDGMTDLQAITNPFSIGRLRAGYGTSIIVHANPDNIVWSVPCGG